MQRRGHGKIGGALIPDGTHFPSTPRLGRNTAPPHNTTSDKAGPQLDARRRSSPARSKDVLHNLAIPCLGATITASAPVAAVVPRIAITATIAAAASVAVRGPSIRAIATAFITVTPPSVRATADASVAVTPGIRAVAAASTTITAPGITISATVTVGFRATGALLTIPFRRGRRRLPHKPL